ncbi:TPM domain-containing protein [Parabacteroides sp. PF5-6]|uniref:TPM domain-containing protein n=1 Tax=Parabacteroides sp. PF5-6 TaxID=1742403 RepID=UPI0024075F01|nr:TPM domain-containing protein [Parabacteroides sp. PF5-6]MDF9830815.1 uncharacterized protein [Parabacteroides sp. PF5-6]
MHQTKVLLWLLFLLLLPVNRATGAEYKLKTIPNTRLTDRNNHVSNPDGILLPADVLYINQALQLLEDSLGIEVAVVAVESIGQNDARQFATDLFQLWGLGKAKEDNGLLIQLITEPTQRSIVFETGYGLEGVLPDAICYRIQQNYMIAELRAGNYSAGLLNGVMAVKDYLLASDYERVQMVGAEEGEDAVPFYIFLLITAGFPLLILVVSVWAYKYKHRKRICPNCGQKTFAYVRREIVTQASYRAEGLAVDIYRCTHCGHTDRKNHILSKLHQSTGPVIIGSGGSFGSGGGGSFGGGFGGGSWGGGSSGGGGSISRF